MVSNDKSGWRSISGFSHGTADIAIIPSVIPKNSKKREVFWVNNLLAHLDECKDKSVNVYSNPDDSEGNHDVIIDIAGEQTIGVQVTELTYKSIRYLSSQRQRLIEIILKSLQEQQITCQIKVLIKFYISLSDSGEFISIKPDRFINQIQDVLRNINNKVRILEFDFGRIYITPIPAESKFYISSYGNIGIDLDFDLLPQSNKRYIAAIDDLIRKKANSKSPWLLIWSLEFWIDKDWLGEDVIRYMKNEFATTKFERVYFMESLDGEGIFQANLAFHRIKG